RSAAAQPVRAVLTREQAIALVRSLGSDVPRVDRIEAKLVPWDEFAPVGMGVDRTGGPAHGGGVPIPAVWAVAVAGELRPNMGDLRPQLTYPWALYGIDPLRGSVATLKVDVGGTWPPGFDALADHVAVAPTPAPASPAPVRFEYVRSGVHPLEPIHDLAAADADAMHLWAVVGGRPDPVNGVPATLMRSDDGGTTWRTVLTDPTRGSGPDHVAASGSLVLVSDLGMDTASNGTSSTGGLYRSTDDGSTWSRVLTDPVRTVRVVSYRGVRWFLAERFWVSRGAATGPSQVLASADGASWRTIGEVPGPASFGLLDVPLVSFSKNTPGDGLFRVEGRDLASLRLAPVTGSKQAWSMLTNGSDLWSFFPCCMSGQPRLSSDGGRTWRDAGSGLAGRIAGLFALSGAVYAIGDGAYFWAGTEWRPANIVAGKAAAVFQLGNVVLIQELPGGLWRSPR
ncbi:MAG TPA: hypothetical protein VGT60_11400, partial [Candidatus Limnocylindria bacterium]|nr:hypothetical protein [Candidatus Limnocylindria bacterium]